MVDIDHAFGHRIIGHPFGRTDATDPAAIDLDKTGVAVVDQMPGHEDVVRAFAARQRNRPAFRQGAIFLIGMGQERFFQPGCLYLGQHGQAQGRRLDIVAPDLSGINQQDPVGAEALARGVQLICIGGQRAAPERPPAAFDRPEPRRNGSARGGQSFVWIIAEQHRGIGCLGIGTLVAQHPPDRFPPHPAEHVPHRHFDAGKGMRGLQQIHAVQFEIRRDQGDIGGRGKRAAQHTVGHRAAGTMRHRTDICGNRYQRRGFAFTPTDMPARRKPHHQRILAAVTGIGHHRHRQIEKIDGVYFHARISSGRVSAARADSASGVRWHRMRSPPGAVCQGGIVVLHRTLSGFQPQRPA